MAAVRRDTLAVDDTQGHTSVDDERPGTGPYDVDAIDPEATDANGLVDFGAIRLPVPPRGTVSLEAGEGGRMQAVHVALPEGRLSVSALAAPKSSALWPELAKEINASLKDGGARVRSFSGDWGRELHATTGAATSVFVGVDGPRWMLYGVATGPTRDASALDVELRRMLRGVVVVRGKSPYPVRTVLPLVTPEHLAAAAEQAPPTTALTVQKAPAPTALPVQQRSAAATGAHPVEQAAPATTAIPVQPAPQQTPATTAIPVQPAAQTRPVPPRQGPPETVAVPWGGAARFPGPSDTRETRSPDDLAGRGGARPVPGRDVPAAATTGPGLGPHGLVPQGSGPNGAGPNGVAPYGPVPNAQAPNGAVPSGALPIAPAPNGAIPNGAIPSGAGPNGVAPYGPVPNPQGPNGPGQIGAVPPGGLPPHGPGPSGLAPAGGAPNGVPSAVGGPRPPANPLPGTGPLLPPPGRPGDGPLRGLAGAPTATGPVVPPARPVDVPPSGLAAEQRSGAVPLGNTAAWPKRPAPAPGVPEELEIPAWDTPMWADPVQRISDEDSPLLNLGIDPDDIMPAGATSDVDPFGSDSLRAVASESLSIDPKPAIEPFGTGAWPARTPLDAPEPVAAAADTPIADTPIAAALSGETATEPQSILATGSGRRALEPTTSSDDLESLTRSRRRVLDPTPSADELGPSGRRAAEPAGSSDDLESLTRSRRRVLEPTTSLDDLASPRRRALPPTTSSGDLGAPARRASEPAAALDDLAPSRRRAPEPSTSSDDLESLTRSRRRALEPTTSIEDLAARSGRRALEPTTSLDELEALAASARRAAEPTSAVEDRETPASSGRRALREPAVEPAVAPEQPTGRRAEREPLPAAEPAPEQPTGRRAEREPVPTEPWALDWSPSGRFPIVVTSSSTATPAESAVTRSGRHLAVRPAAEETAVQERSAQERSAQERSAQERSVQERSVQGRSVQGRSVQPPSVTRAGRHAGSGLDRVSRSGSLPAVAPAPVAGDAGLSRSERHSAVPAADLLAGTPVTRTGRRRAREEPDTPLLDGAATAESTVERSLDVPAVAPVDEPAVERPGRRRRAETRLADAAPFADEPTASVADSGPLGSDLFGRTPAEPEESPTPRRGRRYAEPGADAPSVFALAERLSVEPSRRSRRRADEEPAAPEPEPIPAPVPEVRPQPEAWPLSRVDSEFFEMIPVEVNPVRIAVPPVSPESTWRKDPGLSGFELFDADPNAPRPNRFGRSDETGPSPVYTPLLVRLGPRNAELPTGDWPAVEPAREYPWTRKFTGNGGSGDTSTSAVLTDERAPWADLDHTEPLGDFAGRARHHRPDRG